MKPLRWSYGVTTVPSRRETLLPKTLESLKTGGFHAPRLFIDGGVEDNDWARIGLERTFRYPTIKTYGNWILSLYELYIRDNSCHRYAIFQDDMVTYKNLRQYLDNCPYPDKSYLNLYTFPRNQALAPREVAVVGTQGVEELGKTSPPNSSRPKAHIQSSVQRRGWYPSDQTGKGAVALVFDRKAVQTLLTHQHMVERVTDVNRCYRNVDGAVIESMKKSGYTEYVHNPSLVQHTGDISSMGNESQPKALSFLGEDYDAIDLLRTTKS